jgi:hypothetical protein
MVGAMTPNVSAPTVSLTPRLLKQEVYSAYKTNRRVRQPFSTVKYQCFCQLQFETERTLEAHIRRAHDPAGDAA